MKRNNLAKSKHGESLHSVKSSVQQQAGIIAMNQRDIQLNNAIKTKLD